MPILQSVVLFNYETFKSTSCDQSPYEPALFEVQSTDI